MKEIFKWNESLRNDFLSLKVYPTQDVVLNGAEIGCELFCLGISKSKVWDWYSVELPWKLDSKFNLSSLWIMESRRRRRRLKNWLLFLLPERLLELVHSVEIWEFSAIRILREITLTISETTMWKFKDSTATIILRVIKFDNFRNSKTANKQSLKQG